MCPPAERPLSSRLKGPSPEFSVITEHLAPLHTGCTPTTQPPGHDRRWAGWRAASGRFVCRGRKSSTCCQRLAGVPLRERTSQSGGDRDHQPPGRVWAGVGGRVGAGHWGADTGGGAGCTSVPCALGPACGHAAPTFTSQCPHGPGLALEPARPAVGGTSLGLGAERSSLATVGADGPRLGLASQQRNETSLSRPSWRKRFSRQPGWARGHPPGARGPGPLQGRWPVSAGLGTRAPHNGRAQGLTGLFSFFKTIFRVVFG